MDRRNTHNDPVTSNTFEYSFPIGDGDGDKSEGDSNKSTPYYTPMEFYQSSFDFPSPKSIDKCAPAAGSRQAKQESFSDSSVPVPMNQDSMDVPRIASVQSRPMTQSAIKQGSSISSPAVGRKLRRFSLYERRSCSPQHMLTRNAAGSVDFVATELPSPVDDKENAKPPQFIELARDEIVQVITRSGNNSPIILKDECASPKIQTFSPKLLASINNLKLANSPLGVISSAGYKNGNYFKFPEIDNIVQENMESAQERANASQISKPSNVSGVSSKHRFISCSFDSNQTIADVTGRPACSNNNLSNPNANKTHIIGNKNESDRKNRKNKNNLTIQITDSPLATDIAAAAAAATAINPTISSPPQSPSAKPKTPTIKSTKEKALSLDSAAVCETGLSIVIQPEEIESLSCDEIDSKINVSLKSSGGNNSQIRQKNVGNRDRLRPTMSSASTNKQASSVCNSLSSPAVHSRAPHKPSPLLHSSNTNLKTLPEFVTLVEFSTSSPKERELCPFKQKSMDLPSTSNTSTTPNLRTKTSAFSSGSLLQRRGSNHSLTLNLHGSCSNLLGNCRGLSVSNYSLGSTAANSTTNLNLKSSCNPDASNRMLNIRQTSESNFSNTLQPNLHLTTQGAKQSLFRRRGSNQSLTLKNSATSCGNLNAIASQNSLNVDNRSAYTHIPGVTRTTSFITPTQNTPSNATPKRGLLERRGSNQSLTLNMNSSFGGIGTGTTGDRTAFSGDESLQRRNDKLESARGLFPQYCAQHHKMFFSSENLNKQNTQFSDTMTQTDRHNVSRPFGSASDLKASGFVASPIRNASGQPIGDNSAAANNSDESNICTCTGVRNIMTRPLSPQRKAEEFKTYLANIQTLQNASNVLKQFDLIKLNYIFDNSYASRNKSLQAVLPIVLGGVEPNNLSLSETTGTGTGSSGSTSSGSLATTSEDCEIANRYKEVVGSVLNSLNIDVEEQKRIFCDLHKEFWDLPLNHQEKPLVFGSQPKNRYKTILPNETTRVILQKESIQLKNVGTKWTYPMGKDAIDSDERISSYGVGNKLLIASAETPYINANYIKGPDATTYSYVATQGPLPNTIFEFWLMVYQNIRKQNTANMETSKNGTTGQYFQKLIMLTNFQEHNRQKCVVYFPVELNEVFIATNKQEVVPKINAVLNDFFDKYLQICESINPTGPAAEDSIQYFEVHNLEEEISENLPQTGNCFVIKNVGIVRKNGFSIRKLIVLYCVIRPSITAGGSTDNLSIEIPPRLLIQRFCCYHYWYPDWPDHRSPKDINTLVDICLHILNLGKCEAEFDDCSQAPPPFLHIDISQSQTVDLYQQDLFNHLQPLPIIHCSAGVGRTGCLTAILNGIRQMRQSLAYSLTSMAADVFNEKNAAKEDQQPWSPINFHLPYQFWIDNINTQQSQCNNDTDSYFTRNTLLYVNYIVQKENSRNSGSVTEFNFPQKLPSLTELPRIPDIAVDILGIVCNLRLSRGGMVQNSEQYELIHRALCLYLKRTLALKRF